MKHLLRNAQKITSRFTFTKLWKFSKRVFRFRFTKLPKFSKPGALLVIYTLLAPAIKAQVSSGGTPFSFSPQFEAKYGSERLKTTTLARLDLKKVLQEDADNPGTSRFAAPIPVDYNLDNSGQWLELENGDFLWRLKIRSRDALAIAVLYDDFYLPPSATLFMYSEDRKQVLGAYTVRNNKESRSFMTGLIRGETAILEYYEPKQVQGLGQLHIFRIDHSYQRKKLTYLDEDFKSSSVLEEFGFGAALDCHINVNCPEGDPWQAQKRSICRIIVVVEEGMGYCTGNLMNNTANDGSPYILTAFHCQDGFTPLYELWRFDFNFEFPLCQDPVFEPDFDSMLGSELRAGRQENDFLLLEISVTIPQNYELFLNGWNRGEAPPESSVNMHHPKGDIKKISVDSQAATIFPGPLVWNNDVTTPPNHHFQVIYDLGTFEVGSSGAALFNQDGQVVGQLHGGFNECEATTAYFGRFALAWEGGGAPENRLKDWLDPEGTNPDTLSGIDYVISGDGTIAGVVQTEDGEGIGGVTALLSGVLSDSQITDETGAYSFTGLPYGEAFGLSFLKEQNAQNGVSTLDLIKIQKHIINTVLLDSPYKMLAADVNLSGSITTLDRIKIQKIILSIDQVFADVLSWQFFPANFNFTDPADPFQDFFPGVYHLMDFNADVSNFNFTGVKSGDVNLSADPGQ